MRQIKGVDSNKLQPIIRHHNDKDFRVPSTADMPMLDHKAVFYKLPPHSAEAKKPSNRANGEFSIEIGESSDNIDRTLGEDDD